MPVDDCSCTHHVPGEQTVMDLYSKMCASNTKYVRGKKKKRKKTR